MVCLLIYLASLWEQQELLDWFLYSSPWVSGRICTPLPFSGWILNNDSCSHGYSFDLQNYINVAVTSLFFHCCRSGATSRRRWSVSASPNTSYHQPFCFQHNIFHEQLSGGHHHCYYSSNWYRNSSSIRITWCDAPQSPKVKYPLSLCDSGSVGSQLCAWCTIYVFSCLSLYKCCQELPLQRDTV